jgi:hypothetical protein
LTDWYYKRLDEDHWRNQGQSDAGCGIGSEHLTSTSTACSCHPCPANDMVPPGALPRPRTSVTGFGLRAQRKLSSMPEGTQRYSRTKMVLPLRVCLDERAGETLSTQWVHTIDISQIGCRLGGLRTKLSPGQSITLQRGQQKIPFRVVWSKHLAANEHHAGMEALDCGRSIWAVELSLFPIAEDSIEPSSASDDSSATVATVRLAFAPEVSASTGSATPHWGLSFGLLLLGLVLALSLYNGVLYEWGLGFGLLLLSLALGLSFISGRHGT